MDEVVEGPLPPFEGGIVHGYLAIRSEDIPGFNFDGNNEVLEEGKGEVEPGKWPLSSFSVEVGSDRVCGTGWRLRRCSVKLRSG